MMATQHRLRQGQAGLPVTKPTESYWHKEGSQELLGHRTTAELPGSADVVIVGSGITGAIAAHCLKERRPEASILMLEAREACWGATGRNGGHCQPQMYTAAPHIASFELRNFSYLKGLIENYSIPCDWHTTTGVHAFFSAPLFRLAQQVVKRLGDSYPDLAANVAVITKGEAGSPSWLLESERRELTLEGLRIPTAEGAVVQWHAASLWPYKLVAFVLERLLASAATGFNLQTTTPVTSIQKVDPRARGKESEPGNWLVHTPRGPVLASHILVAANAYTSHLLPELSDLIVPVRGQVASLRPPRQPAPGDPQLDIGHTFLFLGDGSERPTRRDEYLIQRPPPASELVLGGGRHLAKGMAVGVWDDSTIDEPVKWWLRGELSDVLDLGVRGRDGAAAPSSSSSMSPSSSCAARAEERKQDLQPTHEWTGIMGFSRDGHPWVGAVPASLGGGDGLWVCAGYTGHGMPQAALSAKAVVDMMCDLDEIDLPPEFELSEERVESARAMDTVEALEAKGLGLGFELARLL